MIMKIKFGALHNRKKKKTQTLQNTKFGSYEEFNTCKWVLELKGSFSFAWILKDFEYLRDVSIFLEKIAQEYQNQNLT